MKEYFLVFIVAAVVTYAVTPLVRVIAQLTGAFTPLRERDVHTQPIPRLGGIGIYLGFVAAALVARQLPYLSQIYGSGLVRGMVIAGGMVCLLGVIDDIRELDWITKLAGQVIAAGYMAYKGVQLLSVPVFGVTVLPAPVLVAVTVVVVIVTTNAVNWIDGLDGLAAGIVAIAAGTFFVYSYILSRGFDPPNVFSVSTFTTAALVGCCLGFLPHNFHPAHLFMGDSGALTLGLLLSAATISMTGNVDPSQVGTGSEVNAALVPIIMPLAILTLPLLDMVLAVVRRTRAGKMPWHPDSKHLHHQMLRFGHGHRRAVLILYGWAALVGCASLAFAFLDGWIPWAAVGAGTVAVTVLTLWLPARLPEPSL